MEYLSDRSTFEKLTPYFHLLLWATLCGKVEQAHFFWELSRGYGLRVVSLARPVGRWWC